MSCPTVIRVTTQSGPPGIGLPEGSADAGKIVQKDGATPYLYKLVTPGAASLPQALDTAASPTFAGLTIGGIPANRLLFTGTGGALTGLSLGANLSVVGGALVAAGGSTDLSYDPATRLLSSSTGTDVTLPLADPTNAGLLTATEKALIASALQAGQAFPLIEDVRNNSGATLAIGTPVYVTGSSGTKPTVAAASASSELTAARSFGVMWNTTANNADGKVITRGILPGFNTSTLTEGGVVWLSLVTGQLTSTRPTQPAHGVFFGFCIKQGAGTSGILYVNVINGQELEELHDVLISGATAGQVLRLAADGLWKNATLTAADVGAATAAQGALAVTAVQPAALGTAASRNVGTTAGTVAAGDDSRFAELKARLDAFRDAATFWVSKRISASNSNNGTSEGEPFLTIGAAVTAANAYVTANPNAYAKIMVGPGEYVESGLPFRLKPQILAQGSLQRGTIIKPAAGEELNGFFALDSGCMVVDFRFAGHQATGTSPTDSSVGQRAWAIRFNEQANGGAGVYLTASPYVKDCASITAEDDAGLAGSTSTGDTGGGVEIDGAKCRADSPIRSMVVYGFTQQNLGGPGCVVKNEAYAELVSFFGLFGTWHVQAERGGQATLSGGGCSEFGIYGLVADGYSVTALFTGSLRVAATAGATTVDVISMTANRLGSSSRPAAGQIMILGGVAYVIQSGTPINASGTVVADTDPTRAGYRCAFYNPSGAGLAGNVPQNATADFRQRSQISAGCHSANYVGSGTNYSALPWNGGVPVRANEAVERNLGRVFGLIVNDVGDVKVAGGAFAVDGTTGSVTINTSQFNLSGLNAIGPFSRNGGISNVGVQLQEVSNDINLLASTGTSDGNTAPTQFAVRSYADNRFLAGITATAGQPLTISDTSTQDGSGFWTRTRNISLSLNAPNGLLRLNGSGVIASAQLPSTDSMSEGSVNLYFSQTRARQAISASGSLGYDPVTGVISYTAPVLATVATTGAYGDLLGLPTLGTAAATDATAYATAAQGVDAREWTASTISQAEAEAGTATTRRAFTAERMRQAIVAWWATVSSGYVTTSDSRLTDAREWSAATVSQAEAEAGTSTSRLAFTPQRVFQAIAAWWNASAAKTKLDGIAAGATANSTDAFLLSRNNHTGTQSVSTITGLGTLATQSGTFSGTSSGTNTGDQTITLTGDVTGSGTGSFAATLVNTSVTAGSYGSASQVGSFTVDAKGRLTAAGNVTISIASTAISDSSTVGRNVLTAVDQAAGRTALGIPALPTGAIVGTTDTQTLTNKTLGNITESIFTITDGASVDLNPSNGSMQIWTLGASRTPTANNFPAGASMLLCIDDGSGFTVTWPTITWVGRASAPTLATTGFTFVLLWKIGTTLYGMSPS